MFTQEIIKGSRKVIISANTAQGPFTSRLYVGVGTLNFGTVTAVTAKAKSIKGAVKQANGMLA